VFGLQAFFVRYIGYFSLIKFADFDILYLQILAFVYVNISSISCVTTTLCHNTPLLLLALLMYHEENDENSEKR